MVAYIVSKEIEAGKLRKERDTDRYACGEYRDGGRVANVTWKQVSRDFDWPTVGRFNCHVCQWCRCHPLLKRFQAAYPSLLRAWIVKHRCTWNERHPFQQSRWHQHAWPLFNCGRFRCAGSGYRHANPWSSVIFKNAKLWSRTSVFTMPTNFALKLDLYGR